jgi:hypothetical protein
MKTALFTHHYEGVFHQITISDEKDGDGLSITNTLTGRWNKTQCISLRDEHLQTILHLWEKIIVGDGETFSLFDALDQELQSFEIVHLTRIEQWISLYRATVAGVENCTLRQHEVRDILDWYLLQKR